MRTFLMIFTAVALVVGYISAPAVADWFPEDGHKMHFPQLPDPVGWDVNASWPVVLADDWECSQSGWVQDIHFWGSHRFDLALPITAFDLVIYSNIPGPPSKPGEPLWVYRAYQFLTIEWGYSPQGWYNPATGEVYPEDHFGIYQYNIFLDSLDWFWQEKGNIYWLSIAATPMIPEFPWGWKSSVEHFMDNATFSVDPNYFWEPLFEPLPPYEPLDLAFVINGRGICGDVNGDGQINLSDPICLADHYFGGSCEIDPWASDVNCEAGANLGDAIIIAKVYFGKPGFSLNCCPSR